MQHILLANSTEKSVQPLSKGLLIGYLIAAALALAGLIVLLVREKKLAAQEESHKGNTEALLTAGFSIGYILPLLGIIHKRRAKGRGERATKKSTVFLIAGLPVFAVTLLAAILIA